MMTPPSLLEIALTVLPNKCISVVISAIPFVKSVVIIVLLVGRVFGKTVVFVVHVPTVDWVAVISVVFVVDVLSINWVVVIAVGFVVDVPTVDCVVMVSGA